MSSQLRIDQVVLHNFKSFQGTHILGPFLDFSAIIGPNGGGKSNIMDAISFCLGLKSIDLRAGNVKDLIFRSDVEALDGNANMAFVEVILSAEGQEVKLKRVISSSGVCEYYINEALMDYGSFAKQLTEWNIIVKAKNFLIFQGQVDALAMKSGKELTALFEKISGSNTKKRDYEQAKSHLEQAEENLRSITQTLNFLRGEKKKAKEQKKNATQYEKLANKIKELQVQFHLIQFADIERQIEQLKGDLSELRSSFADGGNEKERLFQQIQELERNYKQAQERVSAGAEKSHQPSRLLIQKRPQEIRVQDSIRHFESNLQSKGEHLDQMREALITSTENTKQLQEQIEQYDREIQELLQKQEQDVTKHLTKAQQKQYLQLKQQAGLETYTLTRELDRLQRELTSKQQIMNQIENDRSLYLQSQQSVESEIEHIRANIIQCETGIQIAEQGILDYTQQLENLLNQKEQNKLQLAENQEKQRGLEEKLNKSDIIRCNNKDKLREETILAELFKQREDIKGKFEDLVIVNHSKFKTAFFAAFRGMLDYIVVDNSESAQFLAERLKENSIQRHILILENLPERRISEALRQEISGQGWILADCLQYERSYGLEKAILLYAGNKIVVDNIEIGYHFRNLPQVKEIITIEGVVLKKGVISSAFVKARRSSQADIQQIQQQLHEIKQQNEELEMHLGDDTSHQQAAHALTQQKNNKVNCELQIQALRNQLLETEGRRRQVQANLTGIEAQVHGHEQTVNRIQEMIQQISGNIKRIRDKIFNPLCVKLEIEDIDTLEGYGLLGASKLEAEISKLREERNRVQVQMDQLDLATTYKKAELFKQAYEREQEQLRKLYTNLEEIQQEIRQLEQDQQMYQNEEKFYIEESTKLNEQLTSARNEYDTIVAQVNSQERKILETEREIESLEENYRQALEELLVKNLEIPLSQREPPIIDYSNLDPKYQNLNTKSIEEEQSKLAAQIEKESQNLEQLASFGKCNFNQQKFDELLERIQNCQNDLATRTQSRSDALKNFEDVKAERKQMFMSTFEPVASEVGKIYKDITMSSKNFYYGGHAILYVENNDEPYNGGVIYSPTPPQKRCMYELDQLSGGEKTIAALALLFAIRSALPAPFYILDEVDAFLDWENCQLLLGYLQKVTETCQCIMVTHKEEFFSNADCLIGATFVPSLGTSKSYSLDLRDKGARQIGNV